MGKLVSILLLLCLLLACQSESRKEVELMTPAGDIIKTILAITPEEQEQGVSGIAPEDFDEDQGMLFFYLQDDEKNFWMPDTYFDLDLFFLDQELKVVDIIRKLPHYKGRNNPELIPRARPVWSRHALEMKSGSKIANAIKVGDQLKWKGPLTLKETEDQVRAHFNTRN